MAVSNLVSDGVLVRQVLIVEEVLPALRFIEVSDLRCREGKMIFIWCGNEEKWGEVAMCLRRQIKDAEMENRKTSFLLQKT